MSFQYKNTIVTLENYKQIFKECTPDVLDEIRSAILDDTPIASFIEECGTDGYKLGQIRMGLREMLPLGYLNPLFTARTIYLIRQCYYSNINAEEILRYIDKGILLVSSETIEKMMEFIYLGADISNVDFTKVTEDKVELVLTGLLHHYPMWLILDGDYSISYMKALMRGMQLEIDITPFLDGKWSEQQLFLLFSYKTRIDLPEFLSKVNEKFDVDRLKLLLSLSSMNVPIDTLCVKDFSGYPVYNYYQMAVLGDAIMDKTITHAMYNPELSDMEMMRLHDIEKRKKKKPKLSGI